MPATWVELRDYAKSLAAATPCDEIQARCSISRAYYAAFHAIEPLCREVPSSDAPDHGAQGLGHRQVSQRMWSFGDLAKVHRGLAGNAMEAKRLAPTYRQALLARRQADYDLADAVDIEAAKLQLLRVKELLTFAVHTREAFDRLSI